MKKFFILIILFAAANITFSQVLEWTPYFSTRNDSITIIYDASQGNGALVGTIPIYVHTGVITNLSKSPTDWKHVKTVWGQTTNQPAMTYLGNSKWQFTINIQSYYQVPLSEEILQLAFVFRNANGSVVGRNADGSDIFLPIFQAGLNVAIVQPFEPQFVDIGDSVFVNIASSSSDNLTLFINDSIAAQTSSNSILYYLKINENKKYRIKALAVSGIDQKIDSTYLIAKSQVVV